MANQQELHKHKRMLEIALHRLNETFGSSPQFKVDANGLPVVERPYDNVCHAKAWLESVIGLEWKLDENESAPQDDWMISSLAHTIIDTVGQVSTTKVGAGVPTSETFFGSDDLRQDLFVAALHASSIIDNRALITTDEATLTDEQKQEIDFLFNTVFMGEYSYLRWYLEFQFRMDLPINEFCIREEMKPLPYRES